MSWTACQPLLLRRVIRALDIHSAQISGEVGPPFRRDGQARERQLSSEGPQIAVERRLRHGVLVTGSVRVAKTDELGPAMPARIANPPEDLEGIRNPDRLAFVPLLDLSPEAAAHPW